jgi:nucleoside-diphosphate-sugar epimerase
MMRILVIGGTGFIGRYVVKSLHNTGHQVAVVHRGLTHDPWSEGVISFQCQGANLMDRQGLASLEPDFRRYAPEIIIDMLAQGEADTQAIVALFAGSAQRLIMISSQDVYLAYDKLRGVEVGPPESIPLTEAASLRKRLYPYRGTTLRAADNPEKWVDDYDKIVAERVATADPALACTILRLPRVYGPGDQQHRLFRYARRMADKRPRILMDQALAPWRWTRGYVEDIAQAIALAAVDRRAVGQIYNLGEAETLSEGQWLRLMAKVLGWMGQVVEVQKDNLPDHLKNPIDPRQHLLIDTRKIRRELGFSETVTLEESIRRTVAWELAHAPVPAEVLQAQYEAEDRAWQALNELRG